MEDKGYGCELLGNTIGESGAFLRNKTEWSHHSTDNLTKNVSREKITQFSSRIASDRTYCDTTISFDDLKRQNRKKEKLHKFMLNLKTTSLL